MKQPNNCQKAIIKTSKKGISGAITNSRCQLNTVAIRQFWGVE
jgi:hypothetical protein